MEKIDRRIAIYPGCSLEGTAAAFQTSLEAVLDRLDVKYETLRDWNCCGATSAHALDHEFTLALNLRNLALAEDQGFDQVLAPCAACYHRLAQTGYELNKDPRLLARVNTATNLDYKGGVRVRNVLDYLTSDIGLAAISAQVRRPLSGLRIASYYGCLNTRIPRMESFDDRDYPMAMDHLVESVGATALDWSYKTECCGASLFLTVESVQTQLVARILKDAVAHKADCVVVACPMCHNNLDTKQAQIQAEFGIDRPVPIMFITQLMGVAFGVDKSALNLHHSFVPLDSVFS